MDDQIKTLAEAAEAAALPTALPSSFEKHTGDGKLARRAHGWFG